MENKTIKGRHLRPERRGALFKRQTGYFGLVLALFASLLGGAVVATAAEGDISDVVYAAIAADYADYNYNTDFEGEGYTPSAPDIEDDFAAVAPEAEYFVPESGEPEFVTDDAESDYNAHAPPVSDVAIDDVDATDSADIDLTDDDDAELDADIEDGVLVSAVVVSEDGITVDLLADWDVTAPNPSPAGEQLLAYLVLNANDVEFGTAGTTNLTVVIDGVNAGFATWARGTVSNGGRTLTVPFNDFQLATSERFGFGLIGDQNGLMGAVIRIVNPTGETLATAELTPRPVTPGTQAWDLVLAPTGDQFGGIQNQVAGTRFNLAINRTSPIPVGDIAFELRFDDINAESARVPANTRFQFALPLNQRINLAQIGGAGNPHFQAGGGNTGAYVTALPSGGWRFVIPADGFNPFQYLPRTGTAGSAIHPDLRVFATFGPDFLSGPIAYRFNEAINFGATVTNATWGGVPETNHGIETIVGGQPTVNNRNAWTFVPEGSFTSTWINQTFAVASQNHLFGIHNGSPWWQAINSLQTRTANYTAHWSAGDFIAGNSLVVSQAHGMAAGNVAVCNAINPAVTPFQGRVVAELAAPNPNLGDVRLWATTASVGNLTGVDCYDLAGWFEVPQVGTNGNLAMFNLPNPGSVTAIRALGHTNLSLRALHYTRMDSPQQAGWVTGRAWFPRSADVNDVYQPTSDNHSAIANTPGQLFPNTNGARDVLFGNYGFPRVVKSVNNQAPGLGETSTFTIQAANVSNSGSMPMTVFDQMDSRLEFVPGSVRVNGVQAPNPTVKGLAPT